MKTSSAKAKGRKGQQEVVQILRARFPELTEDDLRSCPMGSSGEDILLSSKARSCIPWNIEVKRGKAFNLVNACKQAEARLKPVSCFNCSEIDWGCLVCAGAKSFIPRPVAIGRYDRDKTWYATIPLNYLLELL